MNLFRVRTIVSLNPETARRRSASTASGRASSARTGQTGPSSPTPRSKVTKTGRTRTAWSTRSSRRTLMLQTHYVNAATQGRPTASARWASTSTRWIRDRKVPDGDHLRDQPVHSHLRGQPDADVLSIVPNQRASPVTIVGANGHFHSRGTEFDMYVWDGMSTTSRPSGSLLPVARPGPIRRCCIRPISNGGAGERGRLVHVLVPVGRPGPRRTGRHVRDAQHDRREQVHDAAGPAGLLLHVGPQVDVNEHCNAFVYYYPKQDNVNCF